MERNIVAHLSYVHNFDGCQLASFGMAPLESKQAMLLVVVCTESRYNKFSCQAMGYIAILKQRRPV